MICSEQLVWLEIEDCPKVTDEGLKSLQRMNRLKMLYLENLKYVNKPQEVLSSLNEAMPKCKIIYPPYTGTGMID